MGLEIVRRQHIIRSIFVVTGVTTLAGTMMDPLYAPFVHDVLQTGSAMFGWLLTVQGIGGILGGLLIGIWTPHFRSASLFGISAVIGGLILFVAFQSTSVWVVLVLFFALGVPSVGARVGLQTLIQECVPDAYRGRVGGLLTTTGSTLELMSVSFAGFMGDQIGVVPLLLIAAVLTILAGVIGLLLLSNAGMEPKNV